MFTKKKVAFEIRDKKDFGDPIEQMKRRMADKAGKTVPKESVNSNIKHNSGDSKRKFSTSRSVDQTQWKNNASPNMPFGQR